MSKNKVCPNCGNTITTNDTQCSNCGFQIQDRSIDDLKGKINPEKLKNLDLSSLKELGDKDFKVNKEIQKEPGQLPELPDFEPNNLNTSDDITDISGKESTQRDPISRDDNSEPPEGHKLTNRSLPKIPDFEFSDPPNDIDKKIEDRTESMDGRSLPMEPEAEISVNKEKKTMPSLPGLPQFEVKKREIETVQIESKRLEVQPTSKGKLVSIFITQYVYWGVISILLGPLSIRLYNPNILLQDMVANISNPNVFTVSVVGIFISWIFYLVMGWFFGYRLESLGFNRSLKLMIIFVLGYFIFSIILDIGILLLLRNNIVLSMYVFASYYVSVLGFITLGFFTFYLGFRPGFNSILNRIPMVIESKSG